jgi:hypothetical protein
VRPCDELLELDRGCVLLERDRGRVLLELDMLLLLELELGRKLAQSGKFPLDCVFLEIEIRPFLLILESNTYRRDHMTV